MLEERDQRGGHRDDLLGADVHVLDLVGRASGNWSRWRAGTRSSMKWPLVVERGVGLRDVVLLFLVRGEVDDLVGDARADREGARLLLLELGDGVLGERARPS